MHYKTLTLKKKILVTAAGCVSAVILWHLPGFLLQWRISKYGSDDSRRLTEIASNVLHASSAPVLGNTLFFEDGSGSLITQAEEVPSLDSLPPQWAVGENPSLLQLGVNYRMRWMDLIDYKVLALTFTLPEYPHLCWMDYKVPKETEEKKAENYLIGELIRVVQAYAEEKN